MSTTPTAAAIGIIGGADGPTAIFVTGSEGGFDFDSIKSLLDGIDPGAMLPDLAKVFSSLEPLCRMAVLIGPVVFLLLGLSYLLLSPKEANYYLGYRCYFGMGSEYAWRFTQRLAGIVLGVLGLVLTGVMVMISGGFAGMDTMAMAWKALRCVLWEAALTVAAILSINSIAAFVFDFRGEYRNKKRRK